jgi:hypothetical protein
MRGLSLATLMAATAWAGTAISEDDEFKQAVNYVFSVFVKGTLRSKWSASVCAPETATTFGRSS